METSTLTSQLSSKLLHLYSKINVTVCVCVCVLCVYENNLIDDLADLLKLLALVSFV